MPRISRFLVLDMMLKIPIADHTLNEGKIKNSKLEWTIFRPGGLTDDTATRKVNYGTEKVLFKGNPKISRTNLAVFMLERISDKALFRKAVWIHE